MGNYAPPAMSPGTSVERDVPPHRNRGVDSFEQQSVIDVNTEAEFVSVNGSKKLQQF